MPTLPDEQVVKSLLSSARRYLTSQPVANQGDEVIPEPEVVETMWRSVLRRIPNDVEYAPPDDIVDEDFRCPVCLCWPVNPVIVGCPAGHMLCRSCTSSLPSKVCPIDRQHFTQIDAPQRPITSRLDRLKTFCPYRAAGCTWSGSRGDLLEHCTTCDHALMECRQCGAYVRRNERVGHVHAFEVGTRVIWRDGQAIGEVLRTDALDDLLTVRFADGTMACLRHELRPAPRDAQLTNKEGETGTAPPVDAATGQESLRHAQIDSALNIFEQAERLNACFVVDCTGSMGGYIRAVKSQILRIVHELLLRLPSMQLHLAFVGYRDHCDTRRFELLPFTSSVEDFRAFVSTVNANGGGDAPEDVAGGLQQALELQWGIGGAATRILIHIADAPCHGKRYHNLSDEYPQGDPHGLQPSTLLRELNEKQVQYIFGRINNSTDQMIRVFDEGVGGNYIQTREMRDTNLVADTVTSSLHASVATTVSTLSSGCRASTRVETSDEIPCWGEIETQLVQLHCCQKVEHIADLRKEAPSSATRRFKPSQARIQLAKLPFSQGETRAARYAILDGHQDAVAKHMKVSAADALLEADELVDEEGDKMEELLCLSEVSAVAAFLADNFSSEQDVGSRISFLESSVAVPAAGGKPFNIEDALPASQFRRFSNNIGWWEPNTDKLLMRFMRWTYEVTDGHMMVVDLQGVRTNDGFVLTDPCILCTDVTRFGSGNLGPRALERCLASLALRLDTEEPVFEDELAASDGRLAGAAPSFSEWSAASFDCSAPFVGEKLRWEDTSAFSFVDKAMPQPEGVVAKAASSTSSVLSAALNKVGVRKSKSSEMPPETGKASAKAVVEKTGLDIDAIIAGLLIPSQTARSARLPNEGIVKLLLAAARSVLLEQPALLELEAPLNILGDIHGQYPDLLRFFELGIVTESNYLFLGDYVDRGRQSLEVITLLLALKVKRPEHMFLLRGNHECASITRIYGFYDECKRRFNIKMWKQFCDVFNCLPVAAVIDEKIFCCHGGISPELTHLDVVRRLARPTDVPDTGVICDLLWADPDSDLSGWAENDRGVSYRFGPDVAATFLKKHDFDLIVRAHQVVEDGYEFFAGRRLVTLFSAVNYCGEFDNDGGLMQVKDDLECTFKLVRANRSRKC